MNGVHYLHLTGQRGRGGGALSKEEEGGGRGTADDDDATPVGASTPLRGFGVSSVVHPPL